MRLLFWSELFRPEIGGVEIWSAQLIRALQARGHDCLAVACHGPRPQPDIASFDGIPVRRFGFHGALLRRDLAAIKRLSGEVAELKRQFRPDVIHLNTSQPSLLFHEKSAAVGPATLMTVHEPPIMQVDNSMLARVLRSADWVVGISRAMLQDARAVAPEITPRSCVIHNAIDATCAVGPAPRRDRALLVCIGRIVKEKGFDIAIRALAAIHASRPDVHLTIAGDGPERVNLEALAASLDVASAVRFIGWVAPEDVDQLLQSAAVVVIPSRWREPFGLVALQAAEAATPVVAACVGGLAEIVVDGITGLLVPPEDSDAVAAALCRLLDTPADVARMGAAAREHKRHQFDYAGFVAAYEALYRKIAA